MFFCVVTKRENFQKPKKIFFIFFEAQNTEKYLESLKLNDRNEMQVICLVFRVGK